MEILSLISRLVQRPVRGDHRLPLIWLSNRERGAQVLGALVARLRIPRRYVVPHVREEASIGRSVRDVRPLLHALCAELAAPRFGSERLRFWHYELVAWLMGLNLSQLGTADRAREIITLLHERHRRRSRDIDREINEIDLGPQYRLPIWLIWRILPTTLFRAAVSGNFLGFGSRYRWFMRQQYLAPLQSINFLGFAERLTEGVREREDVDQLDKLLVHAFLEDLRRAYRRRPWRIEGRLRTVYPVVLIDDVTENSAGHRLLQLINEVRNETGQSDPLLVVCSSDEVPQAPTREVDHRIVEPDSGIRRNGDPVYHDAVYREWVETLPGSRRARADTAWYLPILVGDSQGLDPPFTPVEPVRGRPWLARRSVVAAIVVLPVLAVVGWGSWQYGYFGRGCPHFPFRGEVDVANSVDGECIGYSDNSDFRFNDDPSQKSTPGQEALLQIQNTIFAQNRTVHDRWEDGNRMRPYVTLVYLGIFTGMPTNPDEEAYTGEREELEGLATAQQDSLDQLATAGDPLLHIVIANGGHDMQYAGDTVDMIGRLAAQDPTVVGIVGLDESRDTTAQTLTKLNRIGLPVIATTLSADHIDQNSQLYLQIGASNADQARMIGEYSKNVLRVTGAQLYWTTGGVPGLEKDLYVKTLVDDLNATLPSIGVRIDNLNSEMFNNKLSADICSYRGAVVFAGRWSDFPNFLEAFNECPDGRSLNVIADDSVSRYMENWTLRANAPATLPLTYVSKTILITCGYLQNAPDNSVARFFQLIRQNGMFREYCGLGDGILGERVPEAYDAAKLVLNAVRGLGDDLNGDSKQEWNPRSIVPAEVYLKILQQVHNTPFDGVTGTIDFKDGGGDPGEPVGRDISLFKVNSILSHARPEEVFHCGQTRTNRTVSNEPATASADRPCQAG